MPELVLVTGGSGYVAGWCIVELLRRGYDVRTTVRDEKRAEGVRRMVSRQVPDTSRLTFAVADLLSDDGWADAVAGCTYVLHVASPMIATKNEDEVIKPAVEGVERVLRAARDAGVKRTVYTSSCGAVYYGLPHRDGTFTEDDWTNVNGGGMSAYVKSKALAERAAWDFMKREGGRMEMVSVNPSGIFGPALSLKSASSLHLIDRLLTGQLPFCPDLWFSVVDVRDVADLEMRAMTDPAAKGQRFIGSSGAPISMVDIAKVLKSNLGEDAAKVPTRKMPDFVVRLIGRFNVQMGNLANLLGQKRWASSEKAQTVLGWAPRTWQETVIDSGRSLVELKARGKQPSPTA